jgi:hypothetical protein
MLRILTMQRLRRRAGELALAAALAVAGAACGDTNGELDPDAAGDATLVVSFEHHVNGAPLMVGEPLETRYGQELAFDHIAYWTSQFFLERDGEIFEVEGSYRVIEESGDRQRLVVELSGIPAGRYDGLGFHIGVDRDANSDEGMQAESLSFIPNVGHTFFRAEGTFAVGEASGGFELLTFGDVLYRRLFAELEAPLALDSQGSTSVVVRADLGRLFAGIDLARNPEIHGGAINSIAGTVASNYGRMATLVVGGQSVAMSASSPNLGGGGEPQIRSDATPPVLSGALLDFEQDLRCDDIEERDADEERGCFTPFYLDETGGYEEAGFFSFVTANGQPVRAVASGVVDEITYQDHSMITHSDMFRIRVRAHDDAAFAVEYRWLKDFAVSEGDEIEVGEVIGAAGDYVSEEYGIVSLGVVRTQERLQRVCPATFATSELLAAFEAALQANNEAWPEHARDELCEVPRLVCEGETCGGPGDFSVIYGDVDAGRRTYANSCASCHGAAGVENDIGGPLCYGAECECRACTDHDTLATRIEEDMPPEGYCDPTCAANVAAFILTEFRTD